MTPEEYNRDRAEKAKRVLPTLEQDYEKVRKQIYRVQSGAERVLRRLRRKEENLSDEIDRAKRDIRYVEGYWFDRPTASRAD